VTRFTIVSRYSTVVGSTKPEDLFKGSITLTMVSGKVMYQAVR
jgi:hypothetical protein